MTVIVTLFAVAVAAPSVAVGILLGRWQERSRAESRRPLEPHEILAELRGPLGLGRS